MLCVMFSRYICPRVNLCQLVWYSFCCERRERYPLLGRVACSTILRPSEFSLSMAPGMACLGLGENCTTHVAVRTMLILFVSVLTVSVPSAEEVCISIGDEFACQYHR